MVSNKLKALGLAVAFVAVQVASVAPVAAVSTNNNGKNGTKGQVVSTVDETPQDAPGNNGTLKVHELGTPSGTENNDPKVCKFNLEGFGFDAGQVGYIMFDAQGKDSDAVSIAVMYNFGLTNQSGFAVSQDFNNGGATLANGHYKATLYGKDTGQNIDLTDVKAKSKVFKVDCAAVRDTDNPTTPGGEVLGETTTGGKGGPQVLATTTNTSNTLQDTGVSLLTSLAGVAFIAAAIATMRNKVAEKSEIDFDAVSI